MLPYYSFPFVVQNTGNFNQPATYNPYMPPVVNPVSPYQNSNFMPYAPQTMPQYNIGPMVENLETENTNDINYPNVQDRQPDPILSDNPASPSITLFKELSGYPNYGNPSGNADILYTGNRGTWTFQIPTFLLVTGNLRAQIVIRGVLDDHQNVPVSNYSARITVNGTVVHNGRLQLEHGRPVGQRFTNWRSLTFNVPSLRRSNRVVIENTSRTGPDDWIAFDWMELRLVPR
ncbi:hypothetical protein [Acetivibrio clariflavus]|uniref:Uncharacterized protein n=1 Tax=Acetivibrio clariflavus (strain DSM 19732 / NBRC 101661 / EBR45) TaxID=720554 RepID=G8LUC1_ACECE|nr:hypothetical protein Clocl_3018 [Acetivibrio clariflavus DSM 19732]